MVLLLVFMLIIGGLWWGFKVATSDIKGQGDAVRTKNSAVNRIAAQERFEVMYADVKASDQRLDVLAADKAADPADKVAARTYSGAVAYCITVRNEYNAEARKYTAEQFRASDLPASLDSLSSETDCKETTP